MADKEERNEQEGLPEHDKGGETGRDYEDMDVNEADRKKMAEDQPPPKSPHGTDTDETYDEEARSDETAGIGKGKRGEEKDEP